MEGLSKALVVPGEIGVFQQAPLAVAAFDIGKPSLVRFTKASMGHFLNRSAAPELGEKKLVPRIESPLLG